MEDVDDGRPTSDHPIRDKLMDIDRVTTKAQQGAKKVIQGVQQTGIAAMKPFNRTKAWINNMVSNWKDAKETEVKERLADPYARKNLLTAIDKAIKIGALWKAGILLNPVFLALKIIDKRKESRIKNEMVAELKNEMAIIDEKIKDADANHDNKAKYELMRFKNELNKKWLRVAGGKRISRII